MTKKSFGFAYTFPTNDRDAVVPQRQAHIGAYADTDRRVISTIVPTYTTSSYFLLPPSEEQA